MKTELLFASLLFVACMSAQAQTSEVEYRPFAEEGKLWETQVGGILENIYCNKIDGDTIINGETWKKVYNYVGFPQFNYNYYAAIRDVGQKVYAIAKGNNKPRILYDFSMKVGELVKCGMEGNVFGCLLDNDEPLDSLFGFRLKNFLKLECIDTVKLLDEREHRRFKLTLLESYKERILTADTIVWIEGVGSSAGPFLPWSPRPSIPSISIYPFITSHCSIGNHSICNFSRFYEITKTTVLTSPQPTEDSGTLYDIQGRRLSGKPARGIYIEDGKKKVMK
jgi:hypothetical protein